MKPIIDELPRLYANFLPDFVKTKIPVEELATCNDCAMCQKNALPKTASITHFLPETKCCTYHPMLPNYLVGALLADESPEMNEGRKRIKEKIKNKTGIIPQGIAMPKKYKALYSMASEKGFGRSYSLLCPYYEKAGGSCTIWKFRNAVCSTWFCKTVAGEDGKIFWKKLQGYLADVEIHLINYCLVSAGINADAIIKDPLPFASQESLTAEDIDERINEEEYQNLWGEWAGKEEEFYIKTFELVANLDKKWFEKIMGINQQIHLKKMEDAYLKMTRPILPGKLKRNNKTGVFKMPDGSYNIALGMAIYNIPGFAYQIFEMFDGTILNKDLLKKAKKEKGVAIKEDFLLTFYQNRFLIEAD